MTFSFTQRRQVNFGHRRRFGQRTILPAPTVDPSQAAAMSARFSSCFDVITVNAKRYTESTMSTMLGVSYTELSLARMTGSGHQVARCWAGTNAKPRRAGGPGQRNSNTVEHGFSSVEQRLADRRLEGAQIVG